MIPGKLLFTAEHNKHQVETGDRWCMPEDTEHSAIAREDSIVVEVFSPLRPDYLPK
jgi:quercetin dioxygenase-like cupin family protein